MYPKLKKYNQIKNEEEECPAYALKVFVSDTGNAS